MLHQKTRTYVVPYVAYVQGLCITASSPTHTYVSFYRIVPGVFTVGREDIRDLPDEETASTRKRNNPHTSVGFFIFGIIKQALRIQDDLLLGGRSMQQVPFTVQQAGKARMHHVQPVY